MIVTLEYRSEFGGQDWITCPYHNADEILAWLSGFCADIYIVNMKVMK